MLLKKTLHPLFLLLTLLLPFANHPALAQKAYPTLQVLLLPYEQCVIQHHGTEQLRYHYGPTQPNPFLFPWLGPAGQPILSTTHPVDPYGHRHHRGLWITHRDVNGINFWEDTGKGRITTTGIKIHPDSPTHARITFTHQWVDATGHPLLQEQRTLTYIPLPKNESYLDFTLHFSPLIDSVTFGKTPFGFLGLRVPPTMTVRNGDGHIQNAQGDQNEPQAHWKPSPWIDYTGSIAPNTQNGVTLFDHPDNPRHPTIFHVRDDGWIGASFCYHDAYILPKGKSLTLHYRLYAHDAPATPEELREHWQKYSVSKHQNP